jgi:hypothetical protein
MQSYNFKEFILNESKAYLGQKVGDILTAAQELRDDSQNMGARDLTRFSERIVNQIRRVLHSNWTREEKKHLLSLQKIGVALMKSIEEKNDLPGTIAGCASSLEKIVADLGVPVHKLASTDTAPEEDSQSTDKPQDQSTPPPEPSTVDNTGPVGPPTETGQDLAAPPLGGSSGPMNAF